MADILEKLRFLELRFLESKENLDGAGLIVFLGFIRFLGIGLVFAFAEKFSFVAAAGCSAVFL